MEPKHSRDLLPPPPTSILRVDGTTIPTSRIEDNSRSVDREGIDLLPPPPPPPPTPRADETLQILDLESLDLTLTSSDLGKNMKEFSCYTTDISSVNEMDLAFVDSILESSTKHEVSKFDLSRLELSKRQSSKYELSSQETSIPELLKDEIPKFESSMIENPKQQISKRESSSPENEPAFELTKFEISEKDLSNQELVEEEKSLIEMSANEISNHEISILEVLKEESLKQESSVIEVIDKNESELESFQKEMSKQEASIIESTKRELPKQETPKNPVNARDLIEFITPARPEFDISTPSPFTFMVNKFSKLALATPPASTPNKPWPMPNKNLMTPFNPTTTTEEDVSSIDLIQFSLDESKLEASQISKK